MEHTCCKAGLEYPDEDLLRSKWRSYISPWLRDLLKSVAYSSREEAAKVFNKDLVDRLVAEEDSPQKVFDLYGTALFFNLLGDNRIYKYLLVELSKLVPYPSIYFAISEACERLYHLTDRLEYLEKLHSLNPEDPGILNNLGMSLMNLSQKEKGIELLRKSVDLLTDYKEPFSNYLFNLHFCEELDCLEIYQEHRRWAKTHADVNYPTEHRNNPDPDRKIRIGYISPDYRYHPIGILMLPVITYHDREKFEVFGYSNIVRHHTIADSFKEQFDTYRTITQCSTEEVVDMILEDEIDILIDLAGHTGSNRLDVMAFKPAPVQVTYLGYFDTTGMEQVDYFLTDSEMSPPESQKYHTEELFYMPDTCLGRNVIVEIPDVAACPVFENGYITFGMFSKTSKITRKMARLWGEILDKTKNSRLKLIFGSGIEKDVAVFLELLEECGVPIDRVDFGQGMLPTEYFGAYNQADIMLDTYPYAGGMTTSDALWMGVPVITLVGEHHFSRVGLSVLKSVGLEYFAARTEQEYVAKACALAAMPESLAKIRSTLRDRVLASPLGNPKEQTRNIENAYREMWRRWCDKQ